MSRKILELVQTATFDGDGRLYRVTKLTNTVKPEVGEHLSRTEVESYIRRPGWKVVVKEGKANK